MKKFLALFIILCSLCSVAQAAPIYSYREEIPISDSISLTKVEEFHSDHNLSYSYIKADLTDENTSLKLLTSDKGTDILDTVGNLAATKEDTVAALNADFFSIFSGNKGFALGIEVKDGALIQSPINPSTMASVFYGDGSVSMSYLDFHIMAVAPNGQYNEIRHLNKHTSYFGDILMYTKEFNGGVSPAPGGEVLEVVVSGGKITEFRRNMPPVEIPEDGCVLVVSEGVNMFFANNFNIGDEIKFDYYITPSIENIETAFGGGAMLVSNGEIPASYSHVVSGYQPRSAIGVDKNGTTLFLVAVNGRQEMSRGMTMSELSNLMLSLGCYNAVNLDGGGSTNMTASTVWNENMHTVNSPTENRKVINAVGLTYKGSKSEPRGILLKPEKDVTFIGQPVNVSASVYDENTRPMAAEITWSADSGTIQNGVFTSNVGGKAIIEAKADDVFATTEIYVVDKISGIDVNSHISLEKGNSFDLDINVFDEQGHFVNVTNTEPFEITSSNPSVVSISGKTLKANSEGNAIISVKKDGVISYTSVAVGSDVKKYTDDFEVISGSFKAYPSYVGGSFELSSEQASSGQFSGKLSYDFTSETDEAKGAYFALAPRVKVHNLAKSVSVNFYADTDFTHEMRAQFIDGNGKTLIATFGKAYEKGSWQKLTATIPDTAVRPLTLDRIYALYTPGENKDSGYIYIDDLTFDSCIPKLYTSAQANTYLTESASPQNSSKFVVGALSADSNTLFSKLINKNITDYVSSKENNALVGQICTFGSYEDKNALYINLDTSKGGIRSTNSAQWDSLVNAINSSALDNVFVLANSSVFGSSDFENRVFQDYLSNTGKNVFVITGGKRNTYKNINGVKYFTLINEEGEYLNRTHLKNYNCLEFTFGENVTFEWKSLY